MDKIVVGHPPPPNPHPKVSIYDNNTQSWYTIFFFILSKLNQIYWEKIKEIEKQNTPQ